MHPDPSSAAITDPEALIDGGTVWVLRMLDVAESIDLDAARRLTESRGSRRGEPRFRGPEKGPGGVQLTTPPLDLELSAVTLGEFTFRASVRVFAFGTLSVRFALDLPAGTPCRELVRIAARIERLDGVDAAARDVWAKLSAQFDGAIRGLRGEDLIEDYVLYEVSRVRGCPRAEQALAALEPARLLLAEPDRELAEVAHESHIGRAIQYYADDAAVIGWNAALVLDPDSSRDELEVLEVATARLLELRNYDRVLARELASVYDAVAVARSATGLVRSPFEPVTRRAAQLFVEMTDLYDRVEGAITLVGDAYTARLYREAEQRFRLDAYSNAVKEKLATLARVAEVFQAEISHRRALVLETAVVLLIVFEVVLSLLRH